LTKKTKFSKSGGRNAPRALHSVRSWPMIKSYDIRDIVISHYKHGKKLKKLQNCWQIQFIEVQLVVGYIDTNNLDQFMLNQNQEDQELNVQKNGFIF
jgi:hypothetical protein